jgi:predicted TIM-barrel fold metal-dependent hydrolase
MEFIDSHLHLWDLNQKINSWVIKSNDPYLMQNFTLNEVLNSYTKEHTLAGFITIEAADGDKTLDEVKWLSQLSQSLPPNIRYCHIAYIDTTQNPKEFSEELEKFKPFEIVKGFRDICSFSRNSNYSPCANDITLDEKKMPNLLENLKLLANNGYIYDCQMYPDQLLRAYPLIIESKVRTIIDHCGLPLSAKDEEFIGWQTMLDQYAESSVIFKLSGLEMNDNWDNRGRIIETIIDKISIDRLCYGSNFPLIKKDWLSELSNLLENIGLTSQQTEKIFIKNTLDFCFK